MSENSGKDGRANTPEAKPVRVVGAAPKASESPSPGAAQPAKAAPAPASPAKAAAPRAAAPAAAPARKTAAAPATRPTPAVTKSAATKSTAKKSAPTAPVAKKAAPAAPAAGVAKKAPAPPDRGSADVEETAVRPGFGERLKGRLDQAAAKAEASADKARARREERREAADEVYEPTQSVSFAGGAGGSGGVGGGRSPRRARLRLSRVDPWSVARVSFLLSVALGVVLFVAIAIIWTVLGAAGVWDAVDSVIASVASSSDGSSAFAIQDYVGTGRALGLTLVVSVVNVVLLTAMATLAAYLYNMAAALLGGVEVTLSEDND